MSRLTRPSFNYANVMATVAVFIALGGASYAAVKIPANSVGTKQLKKRAVGTAQLKRGSVGTAQLGTQSVGTGQLQAASVGSGQLRPGSVGTGALQAFSVTAAQLAANAVGPESLQGNAVGFDQLGPDSVDSGKVKDGSLAYADLDRSQVSPRLFAHVTSDGVLRDNSGATGVYKPSVGTYFVSFDRNLNGCVATASVGFGFSGGGADTYAPDATAAVSMNPVNAADQVRVETKRVYNGALVPPYYSDNSFNLIVAC